MSLHIYTVSSRLSISRNGPSHKIVTYCTGMIKALMSLHIYTVSSRLSFSHYGPSHFTRLLLIALVSDKGSDESAHIHSLIRAFLLTLWAISQDCYLLHWWVTKALMSLHICTVSSRLSFSHYGPSHFTRLLLIALVSDKGSDESAHIHSLIRAFLLTLWAISQDCYLLHWWVTKALMSLHICTVSSRLSFSHYGPSHFTRLLLIALVSDKGSDESAHIHSLIRAFLLTLTQG